MSGHKTYLHILPHWDREHSIPLNRSAVNNRAPSPPVEQFNICCKIHSHMRVLCDTTMQCITFYVNETLIKFVNVMNGSDANA